MNTTPQSTPQAFRNTADTASFDEASSSKSNQPSLNPDVPNPDAINLDADGHLVDHTLWTPDIAQQLADTLDVTLTNIHFQILTQVRQFYHEFNHPPATRPLIKYLMQSLPEYDISNQTLQQLFNTGLVARHVNRIAGLPKPPNCL